MDKEKFTEGKIRDYLRDRIAEKDKRIAELEAKVDHWGTQYTELARELEDYKNLNKNTTGENEQLKKRAEELEKKKTLVIGKQGESQQIQRCFKQMAEKNQEIGKLRTSLEQIKDSREWYKNRCQYLQNINSKFREPERAILCEVLANGLHKTKPIQHDEVKRLQQELEQIKDRARELSIMQILLVSPIMRDKEYGNKLNKFQDSKISVMKMREYIAKAISQYIKGEGEER